MLIGGKEEKRRAGCVGKQAFATHGAAQRIVRAMSRRRSIDGAMRPYRCGFCGAFHIGHPAPAAAGRQARRRRRERNEWIQ